jgi:hypothetical protein
MKLAIFYHIAQMGLGAFIYQQQIHRLYASGLIKEASHIHFGVNGDQELFNVPDKAIVKRNKNLGDESDTLISLRDFCKENPDYKVFYFHTKGASKNDLQTSAWRLYMEYYTIDKWKECVEYLSEYDSCGTDCYGAKKSFLDEYILKQRFESHFFAGNFWWANASYVNTLSDEYLNPNLSRLTKELWIGQSTSANPKCLNYSKMNGEIGDFYIDIYDEKLYIK